jgi:hypothetical protein
MDISRNAENVSDFSLVILLFFRPQKYDKYITQLLDIAFPMAYL